MRKSGDPNTSVGNTLINGLTHTYCFHKEYCRINGLDMMDVNNNPMDVGNNLLLLGDDNLGGVVNVLRKYVSNPEGLTADMKLLGLKSKA